MEYKIRIQPEEWACTKFCRIALDDRSIAEFILWLCDRSSEQVNARLKSRSEDEVIWYDPIESMWGWDAPRQRMAMILWRAVHGDATTEDFHRRFSFPTPLQTRDCGQLLAPIQERLKWVMDGLYSRTVQDDRLGQTDWGERWWLPADQSELVRTKLRQTHAELIEQASEYERAVSHSLNFHICHVVQAIAIPCHDRGRLYFGERRGTHRRAFVWVQDTDGNKYPLKHADQAYLQADGTGFEWGYDGFGPGVLTSAVLTDALDGDLALANEIGDAFFAKFILTAVDEDLRISRATILQWLEEIGKSVMYENRHKSVADRLAAHANTIAKNEDLLARIVETGGLRSQRFDVVPDTFEAALYLDLMRMLERGGVALRCSGCGLPISYDNSGRGNKQRARSKKGQPIYHPECFAEHTRTRKKTYWQRRAQSSQFREQERLRAREYRELS
jgi:hypothetical protein